MEENDYLEQIASEEQRIQDLEEQARQDALLEEISAQQTTYQEEQQVNQSSKKSNSKSSRPTDNQMQNRAKSRVSEQKHQRKATEKVFGQSMQQNAKARVSDDSQKEKATKYARQTREENQPKNSNQQEGENSMPEKEGQKEKDLSLDGFYDQIVAEATKSNMGESIILDEQAMEELGKDIENLSPETQEAIGKAQLIQTETIDEIVQENKEMYDPNKQTQGQENSNTSSSSLEENEVIKSENFLRNNMKDGTYINRDKVDDINQQFWNEKESLMSKGFLEQEASQKATEHKEESLKKLCKDAEKYSPKKLRQMQMTSGREGVSKEFYHCVKDKNGKTQLKQTTIGSKQTTYAQMKKQKKAQEKSHAHKSSADMLKRGMPDKAMGMIGDAQSQSMTTFKISASLLLLIIKAINAKLQNAKYELIEKKIRDAIEIGEMDDDFFDITANDIQQVESNQNGLTTSSKGDENLEVTESINEEQKEEEEEKAIEKVEEKQPKDLEEAYKMSNPELESESQLETLSDRYFAETTVNPDDIDKDGVNDEVEKKEATIDFDFDDDGHDGLGRSEY